MNSLSTRRAEVAAARDVLLGDQVHAVPQRRDQHDVGGDEEGEKVFTRDRAVHVVDDRVADLPVLAVDVPDLPLDVLAHRDVALDRSRLGVASCTSTVSSGLTRCSSSSSENARSRTSMPFV